MKIHFYPYDFEYKVKDNKVLVYLYSKLEDNTKICVVNEYQPFFYAKTNLDLCDISIESSPLPAKVIKTEQVEKELLGKKQQFTKVTVNYPKAVPLIAKKLQEQGIHCYEKDILFIHRYLRDLNINPLTLTEAEGEFKNNSSLRVPEFHATKIIDTGKQALKDWKILAVDIETYAKRKEIDPEKNPILMIAFYGVDEQGEIFKKVITWKKFPHTLDYLEIVSDEVELLKRFREIIISYKPDILTGYFSDGFDLPYINTRAQKHKIKLDLGEDYSPLRIRANQGFGSSEAKISGILHLDIFRFIRRIIGMNLKTDSYTLNAVSQELLGNTKHDVNLDDLAHVWDNESEKLEEFCSYNLQDAKLTYQLIKLLFPDITEFTKIIGLPSFDVTRMRFARLVENYILKRAVEFNVLAPNKPVGQEVEKRMDEHIQGAFVFEPKPGIYKNIVVFDFRSLYPTVITAHNIGPESFQCACCKENKVPEREQYWFCEKEKKFLPNVLERLILRRVDMKRLIKEQKEKGEDVSILEARSYALKILANSFYGYLSFFGARWYSFESAASTTAYARDYIKNTIKKAQEKGFPVIYADTDSCFLLLTDKVKDQAMEFMNEINFDLPGHMELEYEGYFPRGIFVSIKGSDKGAKKKYALIRENNTLKITGFETVRRNWSPLAKDIQKEVLQLVLEDKKEEAITHVKRIIQELKDGKTNPQKLILKTQITRPLNQYSSIGPHVLVAKKLEAKGEKIEPGTTVEYIISQGSGLVRERAVLPEELNKYDVNYYLNNQLIPAINSIFEQLGVTQDELLGKSKQEGLSKFF